MELRLARVEDTVGSIRETLVKNTTILDTNTKLLDDHIRRTEILEKQVAGLATEARILRWVAAAGAVAATILQILAIK